MPSLRILYGASVALLLGSTPLAAIVDRNNDGLSDVWAALYHPTKGTEADEDGDGFTNAQEALAGTDPLNAASRFAATPHTDAAGNLVLRWRGAWGKRYLVESSADLKTWTALPELHIGRGQELSAMVRAAGAPAEVRRYWRVVVADVDTDSDGMSNAEEIELGSDPTVADATLGTPRVYGVEYFVSPNGSDTNAGTKAAPFLTLEKAKAVVRTKIAAGVPAGGIAVWLRGGVYERMATLEFTAADSGTSAANSVDWRGYPGEEARLLGGRRIAASAFSLVTSTSPVWGRLDASARGRVLQIDLKPWLGITAQSTAEEKRTAYGTMPQRRNNGNSVAALELFVDRRPMELARWPDPEAASPAGFAFASAAVGPSRFAYDGDRPTRWGAAGEVWVAGYWADAFEQNHYSVAAIDLVNRQIALDADGVGIDAGCPWLAYNLLEEITRPGEWYLDRGSGLLYLWPPAGFSTGPEVIVSVLETQVVHGAGVSFVSFLDLACEAGRSHLVELYGAAGVDLARLTLRNSGGNAISAVYAEDCRIRRCLVEGGAQQAVRLVAGARDALRPGLSRIEDCEVRAFGRVQLSSAYGISVEGCGNVVAHNFIHDAPDRGIDFRGNNHIIEANEIRRVCRVSDDVGAIYSGRDWGFRGNVVRFNLIEGLASALGSWAHGIYLDDSLSGIEVTGNLVFDCEGAGVVLGGGRDNRIVGNLLVGCAFGLYADSRGLRMRDNPPGPGKDENLLEKLLAVGYRSTDWEGRFPECAEIPDTWTAIFAELHWLCPEGNVFASNVGWRVGQWLREQDPGTFAYFARLADNHGNLDPLFFDEAAPERGLRPESPVLLLPDWPEIPFGRIGIRE